MSEDTKNQSEPGLPPLADAPSSPPPLRSARIVQPAEFPSGFWRQVDYTLQHPEEISESLRRDDQSWKIVRIMFVISLFMAAVYGGVMGATNVLQGSEMAMGPKLALIGVTAVKVPVLFLLTLIIVVFPIYVSNAFVGTRLSFGQITGFLMTACTVTTVALASMAIVSFFFSLTSTSYHSSSCCTSSCSRTPHRPRVSQPRARRRRKTSANPRRAEFSHLADAVRVRRHATRLGPPPLRGKPRRAVSTLSAAHRQFL